MVLTRYGELRNQILRQTFPSVFASVVVRDAESNYIPLPINERLVQCIWYDQRIQPAGLRTVDGRPVTVIFPGWWNLEAGPDFRHATVKIGDEPDRQGDIEVHLSADDWSHHGHGTDPRYDNVILHVVLWEAGSDHVQRTRHGDPIPQLVLQQHLSAPLEQLYDEIDMDAYPHNVGNHTGLCGTLLRELPEATVQNLLDAAGDERFTVKSRKFARWIHRAGPEQAFYEGWMEALGYKANKTAFRTLAQRLPLNVVQEFRRELSPLFFGVAGFLPVTEPQNANTKRLWRSWWKRRPDFADRIMSTDDWRMTGIRPANHPHRRLGAAVALLRKHPDLLAKTLGAICSDGDPGKLFSGIEDDFWSHHFTLTGKRQAKPVELIGNARAQEIISNIILPFVAAYADDIGDQNLQANVKSRFHALQATPSNSVVRLAAQQLFDHGTDTRPYLRSTRQQQGLMQIFQDFCLNDKSACRQCHFPELVRRWEQR